MTSGRIIFLNGTSSSGKSSIARELLDILDEGVFFHMAVDGFGAMRTRRELDGAELDAALRRTRMGFHRSIAAMAEVGNDIVVDHVLSEPWRLLDCLTVLPPEDVLFVGVHCPLDELARREQARGDRPPGLAEHQYDLVHRHGDYDLECDTGALGARECAQQIKEFLPYRPDPNAFTRLRRRLLTEGGQSPANSANPAPSIEPTEPAEPTDPAEPVDVAM
ncbi:MULTISPECIES: AAA family ATPase [unclassified Streptomyces]|uniref:chloramphenicol phosphotransferase CPT family protein n=1 Tax=unclassified Streptomyces TaxID=2593676 RepID=UPI000375618C|nr:MULTISPECIES: AAA family ATPase [unclassified Streptomyces]MYT31326.1 AAA family ATPase [Streptomyces sp. SID8354]